MPQATDELREKMCIYFGDKIDHSGPAQFLLAAGYHESKGLWRLPNPLHVMTEKEGDCIDFLCDEWDYSFTNVTAV